jgi:hypothetical protein
MLLAYQLRIIIARNLPLVNHLKADNYHEMGIIVAKSQNTCIVLPIREYGPTYANAEETG